VKRSHARIEERSPDPLRVSVRDLEDPYQRGAGLERSDGVRQGLAEGASEPVPQPVEECNAPRPHEEVHGARSDSRLGECVGDVLNGHMRSEGSYDGVRRRGVEPDPWRSFVIDIGSRHGDPYPSRRRPVIADFILSRWGPRPAGDER
jgi:hypothetical protein